MTILYSWFEENKEFFISGGAELEFKDLGCGSGNVRLETDSYLMDLCAWNHGNCLDIQIIKVESGESRFLHTGDCKSVNEFKNRLNEFLVWFKYEVVNNA